jgi:hypothetical protein
MARFGREDWTVAQLRLTAFPVVPLQPKGDASWAKVPGFEPDELNVKKGEVTATTASPDGKLSLQIQSSRIDWLVQPADIEIPDLLADPRFPEIGPVDPSLARFGHLVRAWLQHPDLPELNRLAFGLLVHAPVKDRRTGYSILPEYIPVRLDPDSSDFLYQVNKPVQSRTSVPGLAVNRLARWSVAAMHLGAIVSALPPGTNLQLGHASHASITAIRLELDVNTVPRPDVIPREHLVPVYDELIGVAIQIVDGGGPQ